MRPHSESIGYMAQRHVKNMRKLRILDLIDKKSKHLQEIVVCIKLNDPTVSMYLVELSKNGFIEYGYIKAKSKNSSRMIRIKEYSLTDKGRRILKKYGKNLDKNHR